MHALERWLECNDPKCRCNDWLAKQPPTPLNRSFVSQVGRYKGTGGGRGYGIVSPAERKRRSRARLAS